MSDELLDGRNLRSQSHPSAPSDGEETDSPSDAPAGPVHKTREELLAENPFALDPATGTHPYVVLEPPATGAVVEKPVVQEPEQPSAAPEPAPPVAPQPGAQPEESDSRRLMKLPRVRIDEADGAAPAVESPSSAAGDASDPSAAAPTNRPAYMPHFHTPTTEVPPVPELDNARPPAEPTAASSPTQSRPHPEFMPHFHTPTGEMQSVPPEDAFGGPTPQVLPRVEGETPGVEAPVVKIAGHPAPVTPAGGTRVGAIPPSASAATQVAQVREVDEATGEIVNADWVLEVGARMQRGSIARRKGAKAAQAAPQPRRAAAPSALLPVILKVRKWLLASVLGAAIIAALVLVVPRFLPASPRLADQGGGFGGVWATATPGAPTPTARVTSIPAGQGGTAAPTPLAPTLTPAPAVTQGRIAFVTNVGGDYEIAVLDVASGATQTLTDNTFSDRTPAWSPDGQRIVFVSNRGGTEDLWVMNADGSRPVQVTRSADSDHFPAWSPDGSLIVFSREAITGSSLAAVDTACLSQPDTCEGLVRPVAEERYDRYPAWAPGGGQIAFTAGTIPGEPTVIALMNIDGSGYTPLAGTGTSDSNPCWSPDGMRIAFVSYARGDEDVWIMSRLGQNLVQLTRSLSSDVGPSWSPDGARIVFASDRQDSFDLYLIPTACPSPADGCEADLVRLTADPGDELDPAWTR